MCPFMDIFICMCASPCFVCTDINCVGGGYTRTCTSVSLCEHGTLAPSTLQEKKKKPFLYFPIPPKSSYISAVVLPLTKLLASRTE